MCIWQSQLISRSVNLDPAKPRSSRGHLSWRPEEWPTLLRVLRDVSADDSETICRHRPPLLKTATWARGVRTRASTPCSGLSCVCGREILSCLLPGSVTSEAGQGHLFLNEHGVQRGHRGRSRGSQTCTGSRSRPVPATWKMQERAGYPCYPESPPCPADGDVAQEFRMETAGGLAGE